MKGTYVLVIELKKDSKIKIGKLGGILFHRGYYCYVGSAYGKIMNLENRISRHKRLSEEKNGNLRWHIDYFLTSTNTSIIKTVIFKGRRIECKISKMLEKNSKKLISKFGCSDCRCDSHFYYFGNDYKNCKFIIH